MVDGFQYKVYSSYGCKAKTALLAFNMSINTQTSTHAPLPSNLDTTSQSNIGA
jgi:hypothetical protein